MSKVEAVIFMVIGLFVLYMVVQGSFMWLDLWKNPK